MSAAAVLRRDLAALKAEVLALRQARQGPAWPTPVALAAALGLALDPWQERLLRSTARRVALVAPRQAGKSTTVAILALHVALTTPDSLVLVVSPAERQAMELVRTVRRLAGALAVAGVAAAPAAVSLTRLVFANGSRVLSLPGSSEATIRGFAAPRLVVVDEASRVSDATFAALRPMLAAAPASRLVLLSTPWQRSGTFYEACHDETGAWERHVVTLADCPRLDRAFIEAERRSLPSWVFQREYLGEFTDDDAAVFNAELIRAALDPTVEPPAFTVPRLFGGDAP